MYYLRKAPYEMTIPEIKKTDGTVIPERKIMTEDRAVYKSNKFSRFYRNTFLGLGVNPKGMHLYTCKRLSTILKLLRATKNYCGEWFDVYDENGIVDVGVQLTFDDMEEQNDLQY